VYSLLLFFCATQIVASWRRDKILLQKVLGLCCPDRLPMECGVVRYYISRVSFESCLKTIIRVRIILYLWQWLFCIFFYDMCENLLLITHTMSLWFWFKNWVWYKRISKRTPKNRPQNIFLPVTLKNIRVVFFLLQQSPHNTVGYFVYSWIWGHYISPIFSCN
jgi:hypothetical protein